MTNQYEFIAGPEDSGERLDRFLARAAKMSLRAARRFVVRGAVLVDGRERSVAHKLREGQTVVLAEEGGQAVTSWGAPEPDQVLRNGQGTERPSGTPRLILSTPEFAAFIKPRGLHTAVLTGSPESSLEALLPELFPDGPVNLVNRLDRDTSGIVLGARTPAAARAFRDFENRGEVDKRYLALVLGDIERPVVLRKALDTANRARTRVLDHDTPDSTRWTSVRPVGHLAGLTLVEARIVKGARHQIRAHLARAGHPLSGDELYGGPTDSRLRLHHFLLDFPGFRISLGPDRAGLAGFEELAPLADRVDSADSDRLQALIEQFMEDIPCDS